MRKLLCLVALTTVSARAHAQDRDYCPARPGLGDEPCTIAGGHVSIETGIAAWEHDRQDGVRSNSLTVGQTLARAGISERTELDIGWTPFAGQWQRDLASGARQYSGGVGDVTLAAKHNLRNPDGSGLSIALEPFATLLVGHGPAAAGSWSAGMIVPVSYDLGKGFGLGLTSGMAAAPNESGHGRHFQVNSIIGLTLPIGHAVATTLEFEGIRDEDPAGASTQGLAAISFAWTPAKTLQLDIGGAAGLDRSAPDVQLSFGIARLF